MMKRFNWSVMAAAGLGCLLFAGTASAQSTGSTAGTSAGGTPLESRAEGKVQSVDATKKIVTLADQGTVETNWGTLVVKDGDAAHLGDIKEGDTVRASYTDADPFHAARIEVTSPKAKAN